jgi:hypothetical protein
MAEQPSPTLQSLGAGVSTPAPLRARRPTEGGGGGCGVPASAFQEMYDAFYPRGREGGWHDPAGRPRSPLTEEARRALLLASPTAQPKRVGSSAVQTALRNSAPPAYYPPRRRGSRSKGKGGRRDPRPHDDLSVVRARCMGAHAQASCG